MTIQDEIDKTKRRLAELEAAQSRCSHTWGKPTYDPYDTGGYLTTDSQGWRPREVSLPRETHRRWARKCNTCGKIEHTEKTRTTTRPGCTVPGTITHEEVPDFGEDRRPTMPSWFP